MTVPSTPCDGVHVWYTLTEPLRSPELLAWYLVLLSPAERARHDRFLFEHDRHTFLVAHALVRTTLSKYAAVAPEAWRFRENEHGRPEIDMVSDAPPLRYSLSHTAGLVACAVTLAREVGVDVEHLDRQTIDQHVADRYFSAAEVEALGRLVETERRDAFFDLWTLKESYIKARGFGLSLPLDQFSFDLAAHRSPVISFAPELADDPASWQFAIFRPAPRHTLALAVRRSTDHDLPIALRQVTPVAD